VVSGSPCTSAGGASAIVRLETTKLTVDTMDSPATEFRVFALNLAPPLQSPALAIRNEFAALDRWRSGGQKPMALVAPSPSSERQHKEGYSPMS
jgi:hypothetical protein